MFLNKNLIARRMSTLAAGLFLVGFGFAPCSSRAAAFRVTKTADTNGVCDSGVDCSLREAINAANDETNHPGPDTIVFAAGVTGVIGLTTALPTLSTDITLEGPGASLLEVTRTMERFVFSLLTMTLIMALPLAFPASQSLTVTATALIMLFFPKALAAAF